MSITIMRPRLIVGPGRLGILEKLFALIRRGLPVPLIGSGNNRYQMVSVHDCVSAAVLAVKAGIPNREFNLGSEDPPRVKDLLGDLIKRVGSRSFLLATPAPAVKATLSLLDKLGLTLLYPDQFAIADAEYIVDISETRDVLGWAPQYRDPDMLAEAYRIFIEKQSA
jgi:dTDP-glucose 4,6-dehydratase